LDEKIIEVVAIFFFGTEYSLAHYISFGVTAGFLMLHESTLPELIHTVSSQIQIYPPYYLIHEALVGINQ
jgi:hypothetical protein